MVLAFAGRRIDPPDAEVERFPERNVGLVERRIRDLFASQPVSALVSSAACGADLIALNVAASQNIRSRVILPFEPYRFRAASVTDRPGAWGEIFDRIIMAAVAQHDLVVLPACPTESDAYLQVNRFVLEEAQALAASSADVAAAVQVWDGRSRGAVDYTEMFGLSARESKMSVLFVSTLA